MPEQLINQIDRAMLELCSWDDSHVALVNYFYVISAVYFMLWNACVVGYYCIYIQFFAVIILVSVNVLKRDQMC